VRSRGRLLDLSPSLGHRIPTDPMTQLTPRPDRGRSSRTLAGGPPSRRAIKRRWGPAARGTKFTGRRHPTYKILPDLSEARQAAGSSSGIDLDALTPTPSSRTRPHRRPPGPVRLRPNHSHPCATPPWQALLHPPPG
jgi:hypothetical protein